MDGEQANLGVITFSVTGFHTWRVYGELGEFQARSGRQMIDYMSLDQDVSNWTHSLYLPRFNDGTQKVTWYFEGFDKNDPYAPSHEQYLTVDFETTSEQQIEDVKYPYKDADEMAEVYNLS